MTKWWEEAQQTWLDVELQGNGCVLACQPQSSCRASDERIDFFQKQKKQVVKKFEYLCDNNRDDSDVTGIRYINGGRYELFLSAKGKSTAAIEWAMVEAAKTRELSKAVQVLTEWKHKQLLLLINYANSIAKMIQG